MKAIARVLAPVLLATSTFGLSAPVLADAPTSTAPAPDEVRRLASEAYSFFYPLVTMDLTRRLSTDPRMAAMPGFGPANHLNHFRRYPDGTFRAVVRPNFDTLYSNAWIDLTAGPVEMTVPDTHGRYYLLEFLDMWTDAFALPGSRTSGNGAGKFVLVPPGWSGKLPADAVRIDAPTRWVWLIGRTQTNGPADYDNVHKVQDGMTMVALGKGKGAPADAPLAMMRAPKQQVDAMPAGDFLAYAARLLQVTESHDSDWSQLARLRRIGIGKGLAFDPATLSPETKAALEAGVAEARKSMAEREKDLAPVVNGWSYPTDGYGVYGNAYLRRAVVTRMGLGMNPPEDAVYLNTASDGSGAKLAGGQRYTLHFAKGQTPPAGAFWSVTLYDGDGFPVPNAINRFALGDRDKLTYNADGSLDLLIQPDDPGGVKSANWLPSPAKGLIALSIRIYAPSDEVLARRWTPPPVTPAP